MFSRAQLFVFAVLSAVVIAVPVDTISGDNNNNNGTIQNGSVVTFSISNSTDVSGIYNVGNDGTVTITNTTITGNTVGKRAAGDIDGDNNNNSGSIQNGDNINFSITGSNDVSGVYNIGSGTFNIANSSISGNTENSKRAIY